MRVALALLLTCALMQAACSDKAKLNPATRLEGVIVDIDSTAIDDVNGFTLKDGDKTYAVYIDDNVDYGFPLGHLQEHVQSAAPVGVDIERRDGKIYALTIEDL